MTKLSKKPTFNKNYYEHLAWDSNQVVVGIDEVGRGCLAGPLVTAAVILPPYKHHQLLKDSKILTEKDREIVSVWIKRHCTYSIGIVHNRIIDEHNIWQSTLLAMKKALVNLLATSAKMPSAILVDAMPLKTNDTGFADIPVHSFIKGESKSTSIAAASIIAKVTRDNLMRKYAPLFPGYQMEAHKGYCTKIHKNAVSSQGPTIIHRTSFLSNTIFVVKDDYDHQQTLC